jgi:hypothetical protein
MNTTPWTTPDERDDDIEPPPDSQFESYFDRDSGHWSLRRVPTSPPAAAPVSDEAPPPPTETRAVGHA